MCGIAGIIKFNGQKIEKSEIDKILDTFTYRGPNDRGVFLDDNLGLGHLRLSIIDLSERGHQPMFSLDKKLVLVFNGEIYNYIELREELKKRGRDFISGTDSEVILNSYQEWGEECVKKFNGMWALAVWDKKKKKLFASRDRFGVKPFHYMETDGKFVFASEIKGILAVLNQKPEMNSSFFYNFFDRHIPYENQATLFKEIKILPPAHNLVVKDGRVELKRYWDIDTETIRDNYDYSDPKRTFRELLIDSIRLRMRSDVPVGVCLSGGVDSSVIAGVLTKILGLKVESFSSIYKEKGYEEEEYIREAVSKFKTNAHYIYPNVDNFEEVVYNLIFHHDSPIRMPGTYSQWHVMKCASEKVVVTLDGQGADELIGGYNYFYPAYLATLIKDFRLLKFFKTRREIRERLGIKYDRDVLKILAPSRLAGLGRKRRWQDKVLAKDFLAGVGQDFREVPKRFDDKLTQALFECLVATNLPMLLDFEDRISMAFSLEARVPFLDYRLVEYTFGLNYNWKINGYVNKYILREAFKDILPEKIYLRKDKKGFPTPTEYWFRGELKNYLQNIFSSKSLQSHGIFDQAAVIKLFEEHLKGKNHERLLWRVLTTELWMRRYFD